MGFALPFPFSFLLARPVLLSPLHPVLLFGPLLDRLPKFISLPYGATHMGQLGQSILRFLSCISIDLVGPLTFLLPG